MPDHLVPWLLSTHTVLSAAGLLIYALMSHVLRQRRHPAAAVGWVLLLVSAPYVGIPLYLTFGNRKLPRAHRPAVPGAPGAGAARANRAARAPLQPCTGQAGIASAAEMPALAAPNWPADPTPAAWLTPLAASMGLPAPAGYESLRLHADGAEALAALWQTIDSASETLDVCTFLLGNDALGDMVGERLARRASQGVRVRLMVDGVGLLMGGRRDLRELAARGIRVARFVPPLRSSLKGRLNLRNHRKLALADGARAWCGGRNLAAEYFGTGAAGARQHWSDLSFDLGGPIVAQVAAVFESDWRFATEQTARLPAAPHPTWPPVAARLPGSVRRTAASASALSPSPSTTSASSPLTALAPATPGASASGMPEQALPAASPACAQLVPSGPDFAEDTLHALLLTACFRTQRRIRAVTPYLVPDDNLLSALLLAARRGVDIEIVLPAASNHRLADLARRRAMRELAAAGVRLRLVPHMTHAKAIVFDDALALAGSANLDARSLFLNYELMVAFDATDDVARFAQAIESIAAEARVWRPAVSDPGLPRRLAEGLVLWLAFQL